MFSKAILRKITITLSCFLFGSISFGYSPINSDTDSLKWHQATILGVFVTPRVDAGVNWKLNSPGGREQLPVRFWKAKGKSRGLYLVLPGTGGSSRSSISNYLGELIADHGYDALILANPFSPDFQASFSRDGYIGFPLKDIDDMAAMLDAGMQQYRRAYGTPKSVALLGSSLGGTYAVMMASRTNKFKINKFIALNPPVDFQHAMDVLDNAIQAKLRVDVVDIPGILLKRILPLAERAFTRGVNVPMIHTLAGTLGDDEETNKALIGGAFQIKLKEITRGLFKTPFYSQRDRKVSLNSRMGSITFARYLGYAGIGISQTYPLKGTFSSQVESLDLRRLLKRTENKSNVYVMHSEDDFLLRSGDLGDLDRILGNNLIVFRSGGHCGIDWTPSFGKALVKIIER